MIISKKPQNGIFRSVEEENISGSLETRNPNALSKSLSISEEESLYLERTLRLSAVLDCD